MAKNEFKFSDHSLRKLQPISGKKRSYVYDTKTDGLRIAITSKGTLTFQFQTWDSTRKRPATKTLGKYPTLPLNMAREKTINLMAAVQNGLDIEKEAQQIRAEHTFTVMFDKWLEEFAKPHKKSWEEDQRRYKLYLEKPFGNKKLSWFTTSIIRQWHNNITLMKKQKSTDDSTISPATANRALALASTIFSQMRPEVPNPCRGVKKFKEKSRDRFLQPEELTRFFSALDDINTSTLLRDYVLISLLTGARRGNVLAMCWSEISFDRQIWTIPGEKSKNSSTMTIPLINDVVPILKRRLEESTSAFVFPGKGKTGHYQEPRKAWLSLLKRAEITDLRLHDLRRTMGSYQTMTGSSTAVVGKTLGHKSQAATAVYARMNLDPVRDSMEIAAHAMLKKQ